MERYLRCLKFTGIGIGLLVFFLSINPVYASTAIIGSPGVSPSSINNPANLEIIYPSWKTITVTGSSAGSGFQNYSLSLCDQSNPSVCYPLAISLINGGNAPVTNGTLGTIDPSKVSQNGFYLLTLTTNASTASTDQKIIYIDKQLHQGWPINLFDKFPTDGSLSWNNEPLVADLYGNGKKELIIAYGSNFYGSFISVYDANGNVLNGWPAILKNSVQSKDQQEIEPSAGDLLGTGQSEITLIDSNGYLHVFKNNGQYLFAPLKIYSGTGAPPFISPSPSFVDINNDRKKEIVTIIQNQVTVISASGKILWQVNLPLTSGFTGFYDEPTPLTIGDMANDGHKEIFFTTFSLDAQKTHRLYQYWLLDAKTGAVLPGWPKNITENLAAGGYHGAIEGVMTNVEGGSQLDIVTWGQSQIFAWRQDGSNAPGWPITHNSVLSDDPIVADLDKNGKREILITSVDGCPNYRGCIFAYNTDGSMYGDSPIDPNKYQVFATYFQSLTVGNLDGSNQDEILVQQRQGNLNTGLSPVLAYKKDGSMVNGFPKMFPAEGPLGNYIIADLDHSGSNKLIALSNLGKIFVWDLPGSKSGNDSWPMYEHDAEHSGVLGADTLPSYMISPQSGSTISSSSVDFQWSKGKGVTQYRLIVGTSGNGSMDIYNGAATHNLSANVNWIPLGKNIYVTLMSKINGSWITQYYVYQTIKTINVALNFVDASNPRKEIPFFLPHSDVVVNIQQQIGGKAQPFTSWNTLSFSSIIMRNIQPGTYTISVSSQGLFRAVTYTLVISQQDMSDPSNIMGINKFVTVFVPAKKY
jgi:hypothetical protein